MGDKSDDIKAAAYAVVAGAGIIAFSPIIGVAPIWGAAIVAEGAILPFVDVIFKDRSKEMFKNCGLITKDEEVPRCIKKEKGEAVEKRIYKIPTGLSFEEIESKQNKIENALKKRITLEKNDNFNMVMTIFNNKLRNLYKFTKEHMQSKLMLFSAGYSQSIKGEELETIDLNSSDCHALIAGTTGSGKSEFLRHLLTQSIMQSNGNKNKLEIQIADLKGGVTTKLFSRCSNCTQYTIFPDEVARMMEQLHEEMMRRYLLINEANCVDYKEYNSINGKFMKPIIFVIEEYSLLFNDKETTALLFLLLNLARAANISIILTLQRPDHKTLDTRIKANLRTTVCFKMKNDIDSEIVLGHGDYSASRILKNECPGRGILNDDKHNNTVFQSLFATTKELEELLKSYLTKKSTISTYQDEIKEQPKHEQKKATKEDINKVKDLI